MSGVNLRYVASSGRSYNLRSNTLRTRSGANFHDWEWKISAVSLQYGERITAFTRPAAVYEAALSLFGSLESKQAQLEALHDDFELDVRNMTPGRLIWNDYYIECFATKSKTGPDESNMIVDNNVTFYCPYPFWIKEDTKSFYPRPSDEAQPFLDYPYDYPYDYYSGDTGTEIWKTGFPFSSDFRMTIFGPTVNPRILINGHAYQILDSLEAFEYVVIDSKLGTVVKTTVTGQKINAFDLRNKEESVFDKMPAGSLTISWPGNFGFDITLYEERSEPR
jgi:hypothetical protein